MKSITIIIIIIAILAVIGVYSSKSERFNRYNSPAYEHACEFREECLWDTARWIQLSNGMEGVCTLHGLACPAFSKDHDTATYMGMSPTMVDDAYMEEIHRGYGMRLEGFHLDPNDVYQDSDISGITALNIGV